MNVEPVSTRLGAFAVPGLVCVIFLSACGGGGGGHHGFQDVNGDGEIQLLAFGDSITAGRGDGPRKTDQPPAGSGGYEVRLEGMLGLPVFNYGMPGEETGDGVNRLPGALAGNPLVDQVILLEGINDILRNVPPTTIEANLRNMVDQVFASGKEPILGTLLPACCEHAGKLPIPEIDAMNQRIRTLAMEDALLLIDFYQAFGGPSFDPASGLLHTPEGLHPTPLGYDNMAMTAFEILR